MRLVGQNSLTPHFVLSESVFIITVVDRDHSKVDGITIKVCNRIAFCVQCFYALLF